MPDGRSEAFPSGIGKPFVLAEEGAKLVISFSHLEEQPLPRHRANKQLRCQKPWQWGTAPQLRGFFWKSDCVASVLSPVCLSFAVR